MKYLFILFLVVIGFGCSPKLSPDAGWGRGRWVLVEMKGVPVQQSGGRKDAFINFEVDQKKFRGNGGCNQVNGNYSVEKNTIKFSEVISTKMSCNDIDFENAFLSNLGNVNRHEMKGEDLLLKRKREVLLVLRAK
ncbi:MAG: META domain-containing protein [Chitinophagaceae bacterium]